MAVMPSWSELAARAIDPTRVEEIQAIIIKHCPFHPDVAYVPVARLHIAETVLHMMQKDDARITVERPATPDPMGDGAPSQFQSFTLGDRLTITIDAEVPPAEGRETLVEERRRPAGRGPVPGGATKT